MPNYLEEYDYLSKIVKKSMEKVNGLSFSNKLAYYWEFFWTLLFHLTCWALAIIILASALAFAAQMLNLMFAVG